MIFFIIDKCDKGGYNITVTCYKKLKVIWNVFLRRDAFWVAFSYVLQSHDCYTVLPEAVNDFFSLRPFPSS